MPSTHGRWLTRAMRSRAYAVLSAAVMLVLAVACTVQVLQRIGDWPPQLVQTRSAVTISGAGTGPSATIQAYVLGAVRHPGVYALPQGARVHDLIALAGGASPEADLTRVNLASAVSDGQSVYVPAVGEQVPLEAGGKLNINAASAEDLHHALGLSLTESRKIVNYRTAHGNFTAVSQLLLVPISRATYDKIKDLVTV
jgi:competence protein ComEA